MTIQSDLTDQPTITSATVVEWRSPAADPLALETFAGAPRLGAIVAAAICAVIALVGLLWGPPGGWIVGALGLPGTTMLAWHLAPKVVGTTRGRTAAVATELAISTILVADALVVAVIILGATLGSASMSADAPVPTLAGVVVSLVGGILVGILSFVIGAVVVGIPVAIIVVPAALVWAAIVRLLAGRGWA